MALPVANTTCDIYRNGNAPPAAPDVAAIPCLFHACFDEGREHGEKENIARRYVATMLVPTYVDIRDPFNAWSTQANTADTVYVPNKNGIGYQVNFVEKNSIGQPVECKIAFLDRLSVTWPYPPASISAATSGSAGPSSNPPVQAAIGVSASVIASSIIAASAGITAAATETASPPPGPALVQSVSGAPVTASLTVTWPSATTTGNLLVVAIGVNNSKTVTTPSGWTAGKTINNAAGGITAYFFYKASAASQSSVTFTISGSTTINYCAMEWTVVGTADKSNGNSENPSGIGNVFHSGATGVLATAVEVVIGAGQTDDANMTAVSGLATFLVNVPGKFVCGFTITAATTSLSMTGTSAADDSATIIQSWK